MGLKVVSVTSRDKGRSKVRKGAKPRVYVFPKGETVLENLENRRTRPIKAFRQAAVEGLLDANIDVNSIKLRWSQKAGCSCGCSPGFIVEGFAPGISGRDFFVDVEAV